MREILRLLLYKYIVAHLFQWNIRGFPILYAFDECLIYRCRGLRILQFFSFLHSLLFIFLNHFSFLYLFYPLFSNFYILANQHSLFPIFWGLIFFSILHLFAPFLCSFGPFFFHSVNPVQTLKYIPFLDYSCEVQDKTGVNITD